jgi:hypothetical protein
MKLRDESDRSGLFRYSNKILRERVVQKRQDGNHREASCEFLAVLVSRCSQVEGSKSLRDL